MSCKLSIHYWFSICLSTVFTSFQIWGKDIHYGYCLERLEEGFCCFPGKDWEGVSRKLLPLGKLYQRTWLQNLPQNLPMTLLILVVCKALNDFKEKRACKTRKMLVFLQNLPNEIFGMFLRRAWWNNSKISNRYKSTALMTFFVKKVFNDVELHFLKSLKVNGSNITSN